MKTRIYCGCIIMLLLILAAMPGISQEKADKWQMMAVHEDKVLPSMMSQYEETAKSLVTALKENNVQSVKYMTVMTEDMRYIYVTPVENYAEMDENPMKELGDKIGGEAMGELFKPFNECYDVHLNYTMNLSHELSYNNTGVSDKENPFRLISWYYIHPSKGGEAWEIAKEWTALNKKHNTEDGYRLYTGGMGLEQPTYIVVRYGKDRADVEAKMAASNKLFGEEGKALSERTLATVRKIERVGAWLRSDLSYMPSSPEDTAEGEEE